MECQTSANLTINGECSKLSVLVCVCTHSEPMLSNIDEIRKFPMPERKLNEQKPQKAGMKHVGRVPSEAPYLQPQLLALDLSCPSSPVPTFPLSIAWG